MQQIATLFKVSTAQILAQNNLRDTTNIVAGQILRIPRTVK
jgi:LysM repeat protein